MCYTSFMKNYLTKDKDSWQLTLSYDLPVSIQKAWQLLATPKGINLWFPELVLKKGKLYFQTDQINEELDLMTVALFQEISFKWFGAVIRFNLSSIDQNHCQITFIETAPSNFPNLTKDLAGWGMQNERIETYLVSGHLPDIASCFPKWEAFITGQQKRLAQ